MGDTFETTQKSKTFRTMS
ncbi:hypothetical protein CcCBS67573_g06393 [Chytriomyces confervae]|uniref:Uncharacterized protein n=1 Tax=Chytriomyces confervae TaxID=246404 RepID=A0A507F6D8_9FUNG|nr:hypothetical protein CcCBS67573_g06393 [Chytriomyces confervae]